MNRTLLYYPTIDIPTNSWLRHALLYWDEVSSIVPNARGIINELSPEIQYLLDEGQFRPIKPESLIENGDNWDEFHEFRNEFLEIVDTAQFQQFLMRQYNVIERIHVDNIGENNLYRIHLNKTSEAILYQLNQLGLAKNGNHEWSLFEKNTALLYMSLLAKYLADVDSQQTTIGTDKDIYETFNFKRVTEDLGFPIVSFNLENVLPTPKENVSFEKIISFKKERKDNLIHFKKNLSDFQTKISASKTKAELKESAINFQDSLLVGVKDLNAVLKDSKIESGFKSFKSLITLKSPTLLATAGIITNNQLDIINLPINLAAIGIASAGAIELTGNYIELRNKERAKLRDSPFSYIYEAQKNGIINPPK